MRKRRETPLKRTNPSGEVRWVARHTTQEGKRKSAGTFGLKRDAQAAIDSAYEAESGSPSSIAAGAITLGAYAETWPKRYPRPERTAKSSATRLRAVLDVEIEGLPLRDWPYAELRRRHMVDLFDHMLREQCRAAKGAIGIRNTLSAMSEDAITDEVTEVNFAKGVTIRANDPRVRKAPKAIRVWTFEQMRDFAAAGRAAVRAGTAKPECDRRTGETLYYSAVNFEPMLLVFALTGLRIGEVFALERRDLDLDAAMLYPIGNAYNGVITRGDTPEKRHEGAVPLPESLVEALTGLPPRIDTRLLFPTAKGTVWHDSTFRRDVWVPAQLASGLDIRPHECRHSYVTNLRAAGIDPADLADVTRHDIETATRHYTHPTRGSYEQIREALG
jgi:integrase